MLESSSMDPVCHVVAIPYPGRGHINPMMNLCKKLVASSTTDQLLVTFVVTEEWLGFIGSDPKPANIQFATIPNVLPSEAVRGANMYRFLIATQTKMEEPFEKLLDDIESREMTPTVIIADTFLNWAVDVGNRRNIPVASFWVMSATAFSVLYHFDLLIQNGHFPYNLLERGEDIVDYIPGVSSLRVSDLPRIQDERNYDLTRRIFPNVKKAQYLLFASIYELEPQFFDCLKPRFSFPLLPVGPVIPYFDLRKPSSREAKHNYYFKWLDAQPPDSVLYVSLGSFLSVSNGQTDEMAAGLRNSGVGYLWVFRGEASELIEKCSPAGLIIPWCEQMEVLSHPSVGGFWTHCGWNSTVESVCAGVPMLTMPIAIDQNPNSKLIVEDWKTGWRVKRGGENSIVGREEIAGLVKQFMKLDSKERIEMMTRVKQLQGASRLANERGGSSYMNVKTFLASLGINCSSK